MYQENEMQLNIFESSIMERYKIENHVWNEFRDFRYN